MRRLLPLLLAAILLLGGCAKTPDAPAALELQDTATVLDERVLDSTLGAISVHQTRTDGEATLFERRYTFADGSVCRMARLETDEALPESALFPTRFSGADGTVRWYDGAAWQAQPLSDGLPDADILFLDTESASLIVYRPKAYYPRENDEIEEVADFSATFQLSQTADGYTLTACAAVPAGAQVEYLTLESGAPLVDWAQNEDAWVKFLIQGDNRWTYNGYYYTAPSNYIPTGEGYFHRIPTPYIVSKMARADCDPATRMFSVAMMDVMLELQNEDGYFPTKAGSEWLLGDYGIGPGFYDTRFCTDTARTLLLCWQQYGVQEFYDAAARYTAFLLRHAETCHETAPGGGWLVWDYWHPDGCEPVHTSLNHQLDEIIYLDLWYLETGDEACLETAGQMVEGLRVLPWGKEDGNLHYSVQVDGTLGGNDYPYLTYNDFADLALVYKQLGEPFPAEFQALMDAKLEWILANGYDYTDR